MAPYYLGVDIGSTKSHALICDEQGQAVGFASGGPGNHESQGIDGFRRALHGVTLAALADAGLGRGDIRGAGFGIAGYDWDEDTPMVNGVIDELGLDAPYEAMNDAGLGLLAGSSQGWGISVSAGTGVNGRGRGPNGETARMTGNGIVFGEVGGSTELVFWAVQAVSRAWSQRGPQTRLTQAFLSYTGARDAEDLLAGIARERYHIRGAAAPLVFAAAREGDAMAQEAIRWLGQGLGELACGLIRQLGVAHLTFEIVLSGSMFQASAVLEERMRGVVHGLAPGARMVHLQAPPVCGAVMLGMQQARIPFLPVREAIIAGARGSL